MKLADIFETRIEEKIDPVIKVGEVQDESKLASEIGAYVVTPTTGGHSLTDATIAALDTSGAMVVLCSRHSAQSKYVNEEVRLFRWAAPGAASDTGDYRGHVSRQLPTGIAQRGRR